MARSLTGIPVYHKPRALGYGAVAGLGAYYVISTVNSRLEHAKEERFVKLMANRAEEKGKF